MPDPTQPPQATRVSNWSSASQGFILSRDGKTVRKNQGRRLTQMNADKTVEFLSVFIGCARPSLADLV